MPRHAASKHRRRWTVRRARTSADIEAARRLFREYRQWHVDNRDVTEITDAELEVGLGYLDKEIAALPGFYAPPGGALLLAFDRGRPVGCGGLRRLRPRVGEIKRVYVQPAARGAGLGGRIVERLLKEAVKIGCERVVLDTLPRMVAATALYRRLGFVPVKPYWAHPVANALFFEYRLPRPPAARRSRSRSGRAHPRRPARRVGARTRA